MNKTCTKEVYAMMKPSQLVVGLLLSNQKVGTRMGGGDNEMCCSLSAIYHSYLGKEGQTFWLTIYIEMTL